MITFETDVAKMLPYDREQYLRFFDEDLSDFKSPINWYGVSLQIEHIRNEKLYNVTNDIVMESIDLLERAFKNLVSSLDQDSFWIVNHDDKDMNWFLKEDEKLPNLKNLFRNNNIPITYRGCLILFKEDLLTVARDLVMYPYILSYKNLDISHSKLPLIIKITGHLTMDLLSTDKGLLDSLVVDKSLSFFTKISYRAR